MSVINKILVAYDFSDCSLNALKDACVLAHSHGAHLDLLHVIDQDVAEVFYKNMSEDLEVKIKNDLEALFKANEIQLPQSCQVIIQHGIVHNEVLKQAIEHQSDLIVVGSHGRTEVGYFLLGSVADKVIRFSPVPVYVSREPAQTKFNKVLVPLDESSESEKALPHAVQMAQVFQASIELMHVVEPIVYDYVDSTEVVSQLQDEAQNRLESLKKTQSLIQSTRVESGPISSTLLKAIEDNQDYNLVVMTSHGRRGVKHFLLGSVAEKMAKHSRCDLLIVPLEEREQKQAFLKDYLSEKRATLGNILI